MHLFKKVAIVGVGFIGGSIGLAIKKNKVCTEVVGVSRHKETLSLAFKMKAIDRGSLFLKIIKGSDLVIIATPVSKIISLRDEILKYIDKDTLVTDVGSTKEAIDFSLGKVFLNYIGSHPLAGSEKRGVANASADIFRDSLCILSLEKKSSSSAFEKIKKMWEILGAKTIFLSPKEHDKKLSFVSHLPHFISYALIGAIPKEALIFAAGGLKDSTRISGSDPLLWSDIFLTNKKNLLSAIEAFERKVKKIKSAIKSGNKNSLIKILSQSKKRRELLK
jgi:prephenate dehydrogenase